MKVTELMVGDWVRTTCWNEQVLFIGEGRVIVNSDSYTEDEIKPIPLTKEILEKNGFVYISKGMLYDYYSYAADGYIRIELSDLLDGEWELSIDNYDKFNDSHTIYTAERCFLKVHELQHAMKLCGIEKEIQL